MATKKTPPRTHRRSGRRPNRWRWIDEVRGGSDLRPQPPIIWLGDFWSWPSAGRFFARRLLFSTTKVPVTSNFLAGPGWGVSALLAERAEYVQFRGIKCLAESDALPLPLLPRFSPTDRRWAAVRGHLRSRERVGAAGVCRRDSVTGRKR